MVTDDPVPVLHELTGWAIGAGLALDGLEVTRPSLEDVYLALTGGPPGGGTQAPSSGAAHPAAAGQAGRDQP